LEYFKLNDGNKIPVIGIGTNTFGKQNREFCENGNCINDHSFCEIKSALENGYRYFDCAISYENEDIIGKVISESKIDRSELFLSSKVPTRHYENVTYDDVFKFVGKSLKDLRTTYIDLYLIHHYVDDKEQMKNVYQALLDLKKEGIIKSVGVSSFTKEQLTWLLEEFDEKPAINQLMLNPGMKSLEDIEYCIENDIQPVGYSVLKNISDTSRIILNAIGANYDKSWHQVLLRFYFQMDMVTIPKSHNPIHQLDNISIFDFKLNEIEMGIIRKALYIR